MNLVHRILGFVARNGRHVLVLGLVAGAAMPQVALAMRPWISEMVAALLFFAALRVGPRQALGAMGDAGRAAMLAVLFQVGFPLAAIALLAAFGVAAGAMATFLVLMLAASPVSASPHLAVMTGNDPAPALRQVVIGTALLPLTVVPVFWLTPAFGGAGAVFGAAGGLLVLIAVAAGAAFLIRGTVLRQPGSEALQAIDALSAIALAVVVIGLMSAVGPALRTDPLGFAGTLAIVCAVNFAIQGAVAIAARRAGRPAEAAVTGIVAGNRNVALFLAVLPASVVDPILLMIGCYQIPMYLTPAVMGRFYQVTRARLHEETARDETDRNTM
ncbi:MAG: hypothetical protein K5872_10020 [Rhizobiaceae bacterium]|nr:hypothetical protein [Rhizobiaceae bacterium]MCV0406550.1 hypothetical protein [Rhizobiaceae bacterium]